MKVVLLRAAKDDVRDAIVFYERQSAGLGAKFYACIENDLASLRVNAGIHSVIGGWHRALSLKFEAAIYYKIVAGVVRVGAILDTRRNPRWIRRQLSRRPV